MTQKDSILREKNTATTSKTWMQLKFKATTLAQIHK